MMKIYITCDIPGGQSGYQGKKAPSDYPGDLKLTDEAVTDIEFSIIEKLGIILNYGAVSPCVTVHSPEVCFAEEKINVTDCTCSGWVYIDNCDLSPDKVAELLKDGGFTVVEVKG
jgi:hypothetical protein